MAIFQRTLTATMAAAALLGSLAFNANAQHVPAQGPVAAPHHAHHPDAHRGQPVDRAQRHALRSERMKTLLQLQPQQQAAWEQYLNATTPTPRAHARGERPDLRAMTTPQRLDLAQKLRKERTAQIEQREQATRTFYSSLNASQQKAFDALAQAHTGPRKHGPQGPHMKGHHHGPASHGHHPAAHHAAPAPAAVR